MLSSVCAPIPTLFPPIADGVFQTNIRTTLLDLESDLVLSEEAAQSSLLQDAAMYVNQGVRDD